MKNQLIAILILILFLLSIVSLNVVAKEREEIEEEEIEKEIEEMKKIEGEQERKVEVETEANKVKIESKLEKEGVEGEVENKFEVKFETEEEVEIKLEYKEESEVNKTEFETELEQEVEFDSIVEFVDLNNNGLYDKGEEVFVYKLDGRGFNPISYTTGTTNNNVTEHVISTQTTDDIFKVVLHVVGEFANIEGELVKPTEVKIDIVINNFSYKNEISKLALRTKIESSMEVETEKKVEDKEEEIKIVSPTNFTGFFSWRKTALVDGIEREVKSTSLAEDPEEKSGEIYLIYERGSYIVHEPKIGFVTRALAVVGIPNLIYYFISIGIVIIVVLAYFLLRKK